MSITVDNVSNLTGMRQNTHVSTVEKQEQRGAGVEVGKTQKNAASASLDEVNMGQDGIAITEVNRRQGAEKPTTMQQPAAPRMDTVEISKEGRAASAQLQAQRAEAGTEPAEVERYEAENLSEYTDSELKQLYYKGEITRQEYEDETGETLE